MPTLSVVESMKILQKHGIPTVKQYHVLKEQDIESACREINSFPLVMKLVSSTVSHKTDVGGIKLNIHSVAEAKQAYSELNQIDGFESALVQKQMKGREVIIGAKLDEQFGPTILFGIGGIFVEIFEDVSVRVCPITLHDAQKMISEIKGYKLLKGARGEKPINFQELEQILLKTSEIIQKEKITELDINPLIANDKEVIAVDARVVV